MTHPESRYAGGGTYVVRIYRRNGGDPTKLCGVVETPASGRSRKFRGIEALMRLLNPRRNKSP